jgi:hypothetical protein
VLVDPIWEMGPRLAMKLKLSVSKKETVLYEGVHEVIDAETFGRAFAAMWTQLQDRRLQKTTSIGAPHRRRDRARQKATGRGC